MATQRAPTGSPEVLFDVNSTSSLELSFSTPHATSFDLHEDSKTSMHGTDEAGGAIQKGLHGGLHEENADKPSSKELDGLRTVNLTPTSPSSEATHTKADAAPDMNDKRTSSPPLVLKSAPGTPSAKETRLADPVKNMPATPSQDATTNGMSNGAQDDLDDPRTLVISSLRTQISDLFSQVNLLNSKLVQSYDRVSTLEETLDDNTERLRALEGERMNLEREKNVLELERAKQEQMLKDGRLVERNAVAAELSRLMEESLASSSAKQSAEAKHKQMESELSDLSANLFSTANEMVATERQARAQAEESLVSTRANAAALEKQLEAAKVELIRDENEKEVLREARARTEHEMEELRRALRGANSSNVMSLGSGGVLKMMNSHLPYRNEYLGFLAHLRGLAGSTPNIPAITSLLSLPFLARLAIEDSEPTLRLDLAPSLNWLTRRSVLAAIHSNTLLIEQIHVATLFLEGSASSYSYVGFGSGSSLPTSPTQLTKVNCALCGKVVYMSPEAIQAEENRYQSTVVTESPTTPTVHSTHNPTTSPSPQRTGSGSSWAASKFLRNVTLPSLGGVVAGANGSRSNSPTPRHSLDSTTPNGSGPSTPTTTTVERPSSPPPPTSLQTVIHAFRVPLAGKSASGSTTNLPASAVDPSQPSENYGPPYPLCHTGWCLARLKATCELWGCVRTDVVERVWKDGAAERRRFGSGSSAAGMGELGATNMEKALPPLGLDSAPSPTTNESSVPPLVPPKRKMAEFWGMGKDVLDKAKAYGNSNPGGDGTSSSTSLASTTGGASGFFGGVRRTFSGTAILTNSTAATESVGDRSSSEDIAEAADAMGTVKAPPLPKRNTSRLSEVFTDFPEAAGGSNKDGAEARNPAVLVESGVEEVQNEEVVSPVPAVDETTLPELTLAPSDTVENFVTPSETPFQELSPNPDAHDMKDGASAEALSTAIGDHLSKSARDSGDAELEPSTPTPDSLGFSTSQTVLSDATVVTSPEGPPPAKTGHARSTSIASIISEGRGTKNPRPTTPVGRPGSGSMSPSRQPGFKPGSRPGTPTKVTAASESRPGIPNKTTVTSGSRPSTPSKLATPTPSRPGNPSKPANPSTKAGPIAPPPVPRRAAARNAARTNVVGPPKEEEKPARTSLEEVQESGGKNGDVTKDAGEEQAGGGQEDKGEAVEKTEASSEDTTVGDEANPARDELSIVRDMARITSAEVAAPIFDIAPPIPSLADNADGAQDKVAGNYGLVDAASTTSTPISLSVPLPASPSSRPVPPLPPSPEGPPSAYANSARPRQPSVVSASSVYSPSVYTTNSGMNGPTVGAVGDVSADSEQHRGRHDAEVVKFYVGRETWEERAWLQLVQIRESMFWGRLGGVRY